MKTRSWKSQKEGSLLNVLTHSIIFHLDQGKALIHKLCILMLRTRTIVVYVTKGRIIEIAVYVTKGCITEIVQLHLVVICYASLWFLLQSFAIRNSYQALWFYATICCGVSYELLRLCYARAHNMLLFLGGVRLNVQIYNICTLFGKKFLLQKIVSGMYFIFGSSSLFCSC